MKSKEAHILEMLIRVRQFGLTHPSNFDTGSRGRELLDVVDTSVEDMEALSATQAQHARAAKEKTTQKNVADETMRADMEAMSRTARSMARQTPGLEDKFQLPKSSRVQDWLATARAFAADAEPLKDEFIRRGMLPAFLDNFKAHISEVEETVDGWAQKSAARVSATVAVGKVAEQGREAVRELDVVVRNVFPGDDAVLAEWESASHVERAARHAKEETPDSDTEPAGA
jgi:hypothetical protein